MLSKMSKRVFVMIAALFAISFVPGTVSACCVYDAEKDAYVCGGDSSDSSLATNGGGCGGGEIRAPQKNSMDGK